MKRIPVQAQPSPLKKRLLWQARLHSPGMAWLLILTLSALFFLPYYILPGKTLLTLRYYGVLEIIPMLGAALLCARKGSLLVSLLFASSLVFHNIWREHLPWHEFVTIDIFFGTGIVAFVSLIISQLLHVRNRMRRLYRELQEAHDFIQHQALSDPLTNLPNHRALIQQLEQEQARVSRSGEPLSVLFFDCDHFKRINDTYGHETGNAVLIALGEQAKTMLRATDTVGRYGGEEFVMLLPGTAAESAKLVADRLCKKIEAHPLATDEDGNEVSATVSIGVATYPDDGVSGIDLLSKADHAMYWAKTHGRNRACSFTQTLDAHHSSLSA